MSESVLTSDEVLSIILTAEIEELRDGFPDYMQMVLNIEGTEQSQEEVTETNE